jgi:mono/diheme cytochrome c family protein
MYRNRYRLVVGALMLTLAVTGCRNPESGLTRGPTKTPGAEAGRLRIGSEEPTAMRELGDPIRPSGEPMVLAVADTTPAAAVLPPEAPAALPPGVTQPEVDEGKQIFHGPGACFGCHGQNAAGGPLAPPLNDSQWLHIDGSLDAIVGIVTNGVPQPKQYPAPMPPRGGSTITDAQVKAVAAYVFSISR